ncbi:MAG TPA: glycosyltransferase [Ktedonobacteraceae bacterium]|nr:glycosyltransferase [Ktedonobacteraceae bacterium]
MRILFITPYPPSRIRIRSYGFIQNLSKYHDVTLLFLCSTGRERLDAQALQGEGYRIIAVQDSRFRKGLRTLRALFSGKPLQVAYDAAPRFALAIRQQLATERFDLLHVEFIRALGALPETLPIPAVWDAVDCISLLYEQGGRSGATWLLRWLGAFEARRVRAYERAQLSRFSQILVTAPRDREALLHLCTNEEHKRVEQTAPTITVLPHGIDPDPLRQERQAETLIFSGKMSFHANVAGALFLTRQIMPLIWQQRPGVRLIIAGSNPPARVRRLAQTGRIEVTGFVPDLRPFIQRATIAVCPLPYAVGIQNKILEAMALETPVIASPQAAAGLHAVVGQDLLVASEAEEFANAVLQLLADEQLRAKIGAGGRKYVTTFHDWQNIMRRLSTIYELAVSPGRELINSNMH